jgi:hypothetical protein
MLKTTYPTIPAVQCDTGAVILQKYHIAEKWFNIVLRPSIHNRSRWLSSVIVKFQTGMTVSFGGFPVTPLSNPPDRGVHGLSNEL